jgi:hypothetical protein
MADPLKDVPAGSEEGAPDQHPLITMFHKPSGMTETVGDLVVQEREGDEDWTVVEPPPGGPIPPEGRLEIFEGADGRYYWLMRANNGGVSDHGTGRKDKRGAKTSAHKRYPDLTVVEVPLPKGAGEQIGDSPAEMAEPIPGHRAVPETTPAAGSPEAALAPEGETPAKG